MSCRYQIRVFESTSQDGATAVGTTVTPTVQTFSVYAYSVEEAEKSIRKKIAKGTLTRGKVYQIWPFLGNGEFTRSVAIGLDDSCERVFLDPASGPFSELRRIRVGNVTAPPASTDASASSEHAIA